MEGLRQFLEDLRRAQLVPGNLRAILHICIGRTVKRFDGSIISRGVTWRELAGLLRDIRWDKELVREVGLVPDDLPPRDRQRYWYTAIAAANVNSQDVIMEASLFAQHLARLGYTVA